MTKFTKRTYHAARKIALRRVLYAPDKDFKALYKAAKAIVDRGRREKGLWL
jgi:hypothetical protein